MPTGQLHGGFQGCFVNKFSEKSDELNFTPCFPACLWLLFEWLQIEFYISFFSSIVWLWAQTVKLKCDSDVTFEVPPSVVTRGICRTVTNPLWPPCALFKGSNIDKSYWKSVWWRNGRQPSRKHMKKKREQGGWRPSGNRWFSFGKFHEWFIKE